MVRIEISVVSATSTFRQTKERRDHCRLEGELSFAMVLRKLHSSMSAHVSCILVKNRTLTLLIIERQMSDEKKISESIAFEVMETWSVPGSYARGEPVRPESILGPLCFSRALLFPVERVRALDLIVESIDYLQCPVCRIRTTKAARYCSNCGSMLNPDQSYENSW